MSESRRNILFFFNTRIKQDLIDEKNYINKIDRAKEIAFSGKYHYIIAGVKAIYDHLADCKMVADCKMALDHIICVSDIGDDNKEFLTAGLQDVMKDTPPITWISHDRYDRSDIILKKISSEFEFQENDQLFILTNGGARNNVMFFSTFTQIMKVKGLDTRLIYITQETPEVIKDVSSDNRYFDVLRAVELFTQSGNPKQLKKIYEEDSSLFKLLGLMDQFYKNIQICKTVNDTSTGIVSIFKNMIKEIDDLMKKDDIDIIIKLLLPTIKSKFMPLGTENHEYFLQILKWCCNNDMVLVGFFILDAELKAYLYNDKKVIQFNGFDSNGKAINLPSMNAPAIALLNDNSKGKNQYQVKQDKKDFDNYSNSLKEINGKHPIRGYTEALTLIFRKIVSNTEKTDCTQLDTSFTKIITCFNDFEFKLSNDLPKIQKLYELILLQDFIRSLRNNMAHAESFYTIKGKLNIISFIQTKYDYKNCLFNCINNRTNTLDIKFNDPEIYDKLIFILSASIKIIQDNIKILSSEVEDEY